MQRALGLAYYWQRFLDEQKINSVAEITRTEDLYVRRLLRLVLLAPDCITFLLMNKQVTLERSHSNVQ